METADKQIQQAPETQVSKESETIKALQNELNELKAKFAEKNPQDYIDEKINKLVEERTRKSEEEHRAKTIEEAKQILREAQERELMDKELRKNHSYLNKKESIQRYKEEIMIAAQRVLNAEKNGDYNNYLFDWRNNKPEAIQQRNLFLAIKMAGGAEKFANFMFDHYFPDFKNHLKK